MKTHALTPFFVVVFAIGCETLIRADFDSARPKSEGEVQGGGANSGGGGGTSSGGSATGGTATPSGGARGGAVTGGTAAGGTTTGGMASGGGSGVGGASGAGGDGAGEAGMSGAGGGGSGGTSGLNCKGEFGWWRALELQYFDATSLSVTADEGEYFVAVQWPDYVKVYRYEAASFTSWDVDAMDGACPTERPVITLDVSEDGMNLYFTCSTSESALTVAEDPLYVVRRPSRMDPFGPPELVGAVPARFSVSADEESVFASLAADGTLPGRTLEWQRGMDGFVESSELLGLTDNNDLLDPDPSADGLDVYGVLLPDYRFAVASRPNRRAAFGDPLPFAWRAPDGSEYISPTISADCRTLYFLSRGTAGPMRSSLVMVAYRERCADGMDNDLDQDIDCDDADCDTDAACI